MAGRIVNAYVIFIQNSHYKIGFLIRRFLFFDTYFKKCKDHCLMNDFQKYGKVKCKMTNRQVTLCNLGQKITIREQVICLNEKFVKSICRQCIKVKKNCEDRYLFIIFWLFYLFHLWISKAKVIQRKRKETLLDNQ